MSEAEPVPVEAERAAHLAALASLPGMGPARLAVLLARWDPVEAWQRVRAGDLARHAEVLAAIRGRGADLCRSWAVTARAGDVAETWRRHVDAGVAVVTPGDPAYPRRLVDDPERPAVLFHRGPVEALVGPAVAVVGTRRCTRYGHDVARELGGRLAGLGVTVVSGLAAGIDAAAHRGALDAAGAAPAAVVATGLDVVYPRANRALWEEVSGCGVVLSEAPLGTAPEAWRFPARNRIIAGLAEVTVVVESHAAGGSLYTVEEAVLRDRPVLAVPGSIRSPASVGTNRLLADGAEPLCSVDDVVIALGLVGDARPGSASAAAGRSVPGPPVDDEQRSVLDAVGWEPTALDRVLAATGLSVESASLAIERLVADGRLERRGAWLEQVAR